MAIQTLDTAKLAEETGNLYETVAVLSMRARQLASKTKAELEGRLSYFEDLSLDPAEELRSNEDQLRISLEYERQPKPTRAAIDEIQDGELYFRNPTPDEIGEDGI
ncbi:DNA-directed RNA polymerase subunit omega [Rubrivirga sp. IMCC45206]|uniref:DNA-directed RNA polymerase subunit omega n=1 Tax=Rubrivirga sp. IMCC45206 TaxID=3391614 RepID=UPI00398FFAC3